MAKLIKHICEDCGKEFLGGRYPRFCPDCRKRRQRAHAKAVRKCVVCGREFVGTARSLYCPACRLEKHRENYHRHLKRKKEGDTIVRGETVGICEICGKPFIMMAGIQKYCSDCAPEAYKEADRRRSYEWEEREKQKLLESEEIAREIRNARDE